MKNWAIDEFINECEELYNNQYTYDYDNMPDGVCNGHTVGAYQGLWRSVVIDNVIYTMDAATWYDYKWHKTHKGMTCIEYIRYKLEQ